MFSFLFASASAFPDDIAVQMNLNNKMLIMIRTAFPHQHIVKLFLRILLDDLLQSRFIILKGLGLGIFHFRDGKAQDELPGLFHAAV